MTATGSAGPLPWLVLPSGVAEGSLDRLLTLGEQADAAGWHTICVADSALALGFHDSTVALAALAARTGRARLAVACMATLGLRNPLIVAQQWANLDVLSHGRVTLIACPGNRTGVRHERELAAFGLGYDEKVERMEEYIAFLREVSNSEAVTFEGRYVNVTDLRIVPPYLQRPLPLWLAANPNPTAGPVTLDRVLGRVARLADGWLTYNIRPRQLAPRVEQLSELRAQLPTPQPAAAPGPIPVTVQVRFTLADTEAAAVDEARAAWARSSTRGISADDLTEVFAVGTADRALDLLHRLAAAGATAVALSPLGADPGEQIARASAELLPELGAQPVGSAR